MHWCLRGFSRRLDCCLVLIIRAELIITICLPVQDWTCNDQHQHPEQSNKHRYSRFMPSSCRFNVYFAAAAIFFQPHVCFEPAAVKIFLLLENIFSTVTGRNAHYDCMRNSIFAAEKSSFPAAFGMDPSYTPAFIKGKFSTSFLYTFV